MAYSTATPYRGVHLGLRAMFSLDRQSTLLRATDLNVNYYFTLYYKQSNFFPSHQI
jgi:hypothetical protein